MHFYVFIYSDDAKWKKIPIYDTTCGTLKAALARLDGRNGFVTVDSVPKDFWY